MRRRDLVAALAATAASAAAQNTPLRKGRFKQAAMMVNFGPNATLEDACKHPARTGADRPDQILNRLHVAFDIYHAQRIDGGICRNVRGNYQWIGHFHAAGVPGRNEIDDTQELNYRFIAKAIAELSYTGVIADEWRPLPGRDPVQSLGEAFKIMDA